MERALTRLWALGFRWGATTVVSSRFCGLISKYLLLLQLQHVLQIQHLLFAGMELLLLFHAKFAVPHHLRQKCSLVLLDCIYHLLWICIPSILSFKCLILEGLGHFWSLNVVSVRHLLNLNHRLQFLTEVHLWLSCHLLTKNGVISDLIYLIVWIWLIIWPRINTILCGWGPVTSCSLRLLDMILCRIQWLLMPDSEVSILGLSVCLREQSLSLIALRSLELRLHRLQVRLKTEIGTLHGVGLKLAGWLLEQIQAASNRGHLDEYVNHVTGT